MSDREMMEEVLELLAASSPSQLNPVSIDASTTGSNHNSIVSHSSINGSGRDNESGDNGIQSSLGAASAEDIGDEEAGCEPNEESSNNEALEVNHSQGHKAVQFQTMQEQGAVAALGHAQHMQHSIPSPLLPLVDAPSRRPFAPWSPPLIHSPFVPPFFGSAPALTAAVVSPSATLPVMPQFAAPMEIPNLTPISPKIPHKLSSPYEKPRPSPPCSTSHVLSTGQRVSVLNPAEFDDLRRKLRMQTASRRYRKRKKEESRRQKMQIQELQAELARLRDLEGQTKKYQRRWIKSLEDELKIHHDEITDLSKKLQDATKEELDWINLMSAHLCK